LKFKHDELRVCSIGDLMISFVRIHLSRREGHLCVKYLFICSVLPSDHDGTKGTTHQHQRIKKKDKEKRTNMKGKRKESSDNGKKNNINIIFDSTIYL